MKRIVLWVLIAFILLSLTACAAGPNTMVNTEYRNGKAAGFGLGLWHGIITPVTFIISLFKKTVGIYETHNSGGWYNFGFVLGLSIIFGGSGGAGRRAVRRRRD